MMMKRTTRSCALADLRLFWHSCSRHRQPIELDAGRQLVRVARPTPTPTTKKFERRQARETAVLVRERIGVQALSAYFLLARWSSWRSLSVSVGDG
jgi:hypothetical protein